MESTGGNEKRKEGGREGMVGLGSRLTHPAGLFYGRGPYPWQNFEISVYEG